VSKNFNLLLQGPSSFSPSKISSLNFELNLTNDSPIEELNIYEFYSVDINKDFSDHEKLFELLSSKNLLISLIFLLVRDLEPLAHGHPKQAKL